MIDFAPETLAALAAQSTTTAPRTVAVTVPVVDVVQETRVIQPSASAAAGYLMRPDAEWGWSDLRDFVIAEIEKRHGPQLRDPKREKSIFQGFMNRWPENSVGIARAAFGPAHNGMWRNAPISVNRFCKGSDVYFSAIIAERL